jgi:GNAT superfamily N-acetyltransferase
MEQVNPLDSMYAAYKLEFENVHTVWEPNIGFANWKEEQDGIYVQEVFVNKNVRGIRHAARLTDKCIQHAKETLKKPIYRVYTTVGIGGNTVDASLRAITEYGFKLLKSDHELIYFYKELNHE